MRDFIVKEKRYFEVFIETQQTLNTKSKSRITSGEVIEKNIPGANHIIFSSKLETLIARYSKGDSIEEIKTEYISVLDFMIKGWDDVAVKFQKGRPPKRVMLDKYFLMPYNYMIWMLSFAILLKVSENEVNTLRKLIEDGNISDELIISLLSFLIGSDTIKETEKTTYKPFSGLIKTGKLIGTEKQMKGYLDKWYQNTKLLTWHNYTPEEGKYYYFGRWSFESAAVVAIKGLDDSVFKENEYYPKDLVEYYRANTV